MKTISHIITVILILASVINLHSQDMKGDPSYRQLYDQGQFREALPIILKNLDEIYSTRVEDKRVPTEFISLKNTEQDIDLKAVFRDRKARGFFIEENSELHTLHLYAGRCYAGTKEYIRAINQFIMALRYKKIEYGKDDAIYYDLSQALKKEGLFQAYVDSLETAYTLNTAQYRYSLELGLDLARTSEKKKALFHLERYIHQSGETIEPRLLLMAGNLHEDLGQYLNTEKYYIRYLENKPDDGPIHFALGYIAFKRTGNFSLAQKSFERSLDLLPQTEIFRRSKAHEYRGDMFLHNLKYEKAAANYRETIGYQEQVLKKINETETRIGELDKKISAIKTGLLKNQDYEQFEEFEYLQGEKGKLSIDLNRQKHDYAVLNAGAIRWNLALSLDKLEKYDEAINWYREAISFDYNANEARDRIIKLQLKIKRGY